MGSVLTSIKRTLDVFFSKIYDLGFTYPLTIEVYRQEGARLSEKYGSRPFSLLDVGTATATPLVQLLSTPDLSPRSVLAVDIDEGYLQTATQNLQKFPFAKTRLQDFTTMSREDEPAGFDQILMGFSYMFMPSRPKTLEQIASLLRPGGQAVLYLTLYTTPTPIKDWLKPKLKYLLSIDMGRALYQHEVIEEIEQSRMKIIAFNRMESDGNIWMKTFNICRIVLESK